MAPAFRRDLPCAALGWGCTCLGNRKQTCVPARCPNTSEGPALQVSNSKLFAQAWNFCICLVHIDVEQTHRHVLLSECCFHAKTALDFLVGPKRRMFRVRFVGRSLASTFEELWASFLPHLYGYWPKMPSWTEPLVLGATQALTAQERRSGARRKRSLVGRQHG